MALAAVLTTACASETIEPITDADCQNSTWCTDKGRCKGKSADKCCNAADWCCTAAGSCSKA